MFYKNFFQIDDEIVKLAEETEKDCNSIFKNIEKIADCNQQKILSSFIKNKVSESDFYGSTGYGYDDKGREKLDKVFADIFNAEDALVRHNFVSGTHALSTALFAVLRPGDILLSITGKPYDTLGDVIGLSNSHLNQGSLKDFGISYEQIDIKKDGTLDYDMISQKCKQSKVVYIQRSRGYSFREALSVENIGEIVDVIRNYNKDAIIVVDNCYGEFVDEKEPTDVGVDLVIGSLIKNPGGGIAKTGGYIAGKKNLIELCGYRLTSPGIGREVGCTFNELRNMFLGLFLSPQTVSNALKTAVFASKLFENLGWKVYPKFDDKRNDIIQVIELKNEINMCAFCNGIQKGSPIDSFITPIPWGMPGYDSKIIMAAGTFTMGASIELSADAPIRKPFAVWMQGALTYSAGKLGVMLAAQELFNLKGK